MKETELLTKSRELEDTLPPPENPPVPDWVAIAKKLEEYSSILSPQSRSREESQQPSKQNKSLFVLQMQAALDLYRKLYGEVAQKFVYLAVEQGENPYTEGWRALLAGERKSLTFGRNYSVEFSHMDDMLPDERAARLIHATAQTHLDLRSEKRDTVISELDEHSKLKRRMEDSYYNELFGATRTVGKTADTIQHSPDSQHILITAPNGELFALDVIKNNQVIPYEEIQASIRSIIEHNSSEMPLKQTESIIPLTHLPRDQWFKMRSKLSQDPDNESSFKLYDTALFSVNLDTNNNVDPSNHMQQIQYGKADENHMFHTCEHAANFVITKHGAGATAEHLSSDGNIFNHIMNYLGKKAVDLHIPTESSTQNPQHKKVRFHKVRGKDIQQAERFYNEQIAKRSIHVVDLDESQSNQIHKKDIDAAIQTALHLALAKTRMQMMKAQGKKATIEEAVSFLVQEPVRHREVVGGRLVIAITSNETLKEALFQLLSDNNINKIIKENGYFDLSTETLLELLNEGRRLCGAATQESREHAVAPVNNLMAMSVIHSLGDLPRAATLLKKTQDFFHAVTPALKGITEGTICSNGGRQDQAKYLRSFSTTDPNSNDGFSIGYMPGVDGHGGSQFTIRACGESSEYADLLGNNIREAMKVVTIAYNYIS